MKLSHFVLACCFVFSCFNLNAQFGTVTFPNEISLEEIEASKLSGIAFQGIRRKDWPKKYYKSTAFFIGKNFLLTSFHNLQTLKSHEVSKITLYPSRRGNETPYDTIILNVTGANYYKTIDRGFFTFRWRNRAHDLALIYIPDAIIEKNKKLKKIDYLPLFDQPESLSKNDTVYCAGYPATGVYAKQYVMTMVNSSIKRMRKNHFSHQIETYRGNSGSPIMVKRNGKFYVIGINSIFDHGTLLNTERQALIKSWMKELEAENQ